MPYKPFLISDMKTGVALNREPWLIPQDAFTEITNGYLYQGVLTKRLGYKEFGRLKNFDRQDLTGYTEIDAGGTISSTANLFTNAVTTMVHETYSYKDFTAGYFDGDFEHQFKINVTAASAGVQMFPWLIANLVDDAKGIDDANGDFLGIWIGFVGAGYAFVAEECDGGTLTIDVSSELALATDYWVTVTRDESVGTYGTLYCYIYSDACRSTLVDTLTVTLNTSKKDFRYLYAFSAYKDGGAEDSSWTMSDFGPVSYPGLAVTGLLNYHDATGITELLAADRKRLFRWSVACQAFEDITFTDIWGGTEKDFVWSCNWNDTIYMTNGVDQIVQYDGSTVSNFDIDINGAGPANDVDYCKMLFLYKERLVILAPSETTPKPQRARWPKIGDPTDWTNDGYVDAPTDEHIVTAGFIGDDLIVLFQRSVWKLRYTADSSLPFVWEQISPMKGAAATHSIGKYSNHLTALEQTGLVITDGLDIKTLSDKLPGFTLTSSVTDYDYAFNIDVTMLDQAWLSYVSLGGSSSDRVLCRDYKEQSWSEFIMSFLVFGSFVESIDPTWDEMGEVTWDEAERTWDDLASQAGYPTVLGGKSTGYIYQMNYGTTDDTTAISFAAKSGRWNPFEEQGMKARMGWIDFLVNTDPSATITINFYKNTEVVAYKTATFVCTGDGDKAWKRVFNGEVADFHRIEITHSGSQQIKIHAIAPYFKPAGRLF